MDEEDDEPFSATNSAVIAQGPKQDVLPRRPQPGGRFPSDLNIEQLSQRGLHAPLSPSSGSSGFGDVQDHDVAAASAIPGSGIGNHYANDPTFPTHAALVNQQAKEDGINPYTYQPIASQAEDQLPPNTATEGLAAAGLGGAALGGASSETYRQHQEDKAAFEASNIAAPDTYAQQSEQQAARESAIIAAPDLPLTDPQVMSGRRSQGDAGTAAADLTSDAYPVRSIPQTQNVPNPLEAAISPLADDLARPSLAAGQNHQSVQSISQLHVPGEFPRNNDVK